MLSETTVVEPLVTWLGKNRPAIVAGPCSAESPEQIMESFVMLARTGRVSMVRAGVWKPRTRPSSFEGIGEPALEWLKMASLETGLPVATEVANARHVELALSAGLDALWIGARTTVNPFTVQEIAEALRGTKIPVFVKNPVNPDLSLWIGSIERLMSVGITRLAAVHRGFSSFRKSVYRNEPMWEIPIRLKTLHPEIPVLCDPSHISGDRKLIPLLAQRAVDLGMDGLMLEVHPQPEQALSDAGQQLSPEGFNALLSGLIIRETKAGLEVTDNRLVDLRQRIDELDLQIIELIASRMGVSREIGVYKKEHGMTILQLERWMEIVRTRSDWGLQMGLSSSFIEHYLEQLHRESILHQTRVMNHSDGTGEVMW